MDSQRIRTFLLFVIAVCLVLITLSLYSGDLVSRAKAQSQRDKQVHLYGCSDRNGDYKCDQWIPVTVTELGDLTTKAVK